MKQNHEISDKDWEQIAKSIYDEESIVTTDFQTVITKELLPDEQEKKQLIRTVNQLDLYFDLKKFDEDKAWQHVESRIRTQSTIRKPVFRKLISLPVFRIAASILIAALLTISGYEMFYKSPSKVANLEIASGSEAQKPFTLPDGSLVSLNSNTTLSYPKEFSGETREVTVEGEAFFEVKPNKNKPFIIHAGKAQVKVLGTSFDVNAYPQTKLVVVVVETGRVQVSNQTAKTNELILTPGEKGTLVYSSNLLLKATNQNPNFLSWKTRQLTFKATPLKEVTEDLEKVYKVEINLADPQLSGLLLTAEFNNYSLDFILEVLESTFRIDVQHINGQYILKARS
jgi:transmembrane sensor